MSNLPTIKISKLVKRPLALVHPTEPCVDGSLPYEELNILLSIIYHERPNLVLEIGTFMGSTTRAMAEILPSAQIHTVDLPLDAVVDEVPGADAHLVRLRDVGSAFRGLDYEIVQHHHDTMTWDFSGVGNPEFIFIDGGHTEECCWNDSQKSLAIAADHSTMMWHDYDDNHPGVVNVLTEWRKVLGRNIFHIEGTRLAYWRVQ